MSVKIIQGEDRSIKILLKTSAGNAYDITTISEISAVFKNADSSVLTKLYTSGDITIQSEAGGEITVKLEDAETALLALGNQSFEIITDLNAAQPTGERRIFQFEKELQVVKRLVS